MANRLGSLGPLETFGTQGQVMGQPLCILGMHRSGTSLLTQMLEPCGVTLGERDLLAAAAAEDNPSGYWEHAEFRQLNDQILQQLGGTWTDVPKFPAGWAKDPKLETIRRRALPLLERFGQHSAWAWKDPRNSLTFPFWRELLPELKPVLIFRNPIQVAMSMQKRRLRGNLAFSIDFPTTLRLWLQYYESIFAAIGANASVPVVHYETLLQKPAAELKRICDAVGLSVGSRALETAAEKVHHDFFRNALSDAVLKQARLPEPVLAMYQRLVALAGPNFNSAETEPIPTRAASDIGVLYAELVAAWEKNESLIAAQPESVCESNAAPAQLSDVEIAVVYYAQVRPTVAMLNALFTHYPEANVTIIDNSVRSNFTQTVLPHLKPIASRINVVVNPATDKGTTGGLSHGAGLDLAYRQCERPFLLTMEPDTFVLQRGCIEYVLALMDAGYDWAGVGQKPIDGEFASFSPCFAMFRVEVLRRHNVSFRRRDRTPDERDPQDPLIRHHRNAAESARRGLPLEYPEGKPPDTYRLPAEQIAKIEAAHENYFDTAEWAHRILCQHGHRGYLFRPLPSFRHTWGSRSEPLFLRNFSHNLPEVDLNDLLPPALRHGMHLKPIFPAGISLLDSTGAPAKHWIWQGTCPGKLQATGEGLQIEVDTGDEGKVYLAMGASGFKLPPAANLEATLPGSTACETTCIIQTEGSLRAQLWVIEYGKGTRLQDHTCGHTSDGQYRLEYITTPSTDSFRVLFRFSGKGTARVSKLRMCTAAEQ